MGADSRIDADVPCIQCGYNLRTIHTSAACPECNRRIAESLYAQSLEFSDPAWRRKVCSGMRLLRLAAVLWVVSFLVWRLSVRAGEMIDTVYILGTQVLGFVGVLRVCARDKGAAIGRVVLARRWAVGCAVVELALFLIQWAAMALLDAVDLRVFNLFANVARPLIGNVIVWIAMGIVLLDLIRRGAPQLRLFALVTVAAAVWCCVPYIVLDVLDGTVQSTGWFSLFGWWSV
ncbi:hypothetical protein RAS1_32980 [Phycisphaerae bacterium RAS1]|nr:hypothetical protein RAS1_32980 [Phycisphaerae bacterium RAS1]